MIAVENTSICGAWIGVKSQNGEWVTSNGKSLNSTGYTHWSFYDNSYKVKAIVKLCVRQSCNPRWIGMIDDDCMVKQAYICELHF